MSDTGESQPTQSPVTLAVVTGERYRLAPTAAADHAELHRAFQAAVAAGEGYPQHPDDPVSWDEFWSYWLAPATITLVVRSEHGAFAGAATIKPNGVGRAAHVANAGYLVVPEHRGRGLGTALVRHSFTAAAASGFDALVFNFVFANNPARRLYERLGFTEVGRVPKVIDGEDVCIYHRAL